MKGKILDFNGFILESMNLETGNYKPPISPVLIPKGDTGFALAKKNYHRFIWNFSKYNKLKKNKKISERMEGSIIKDIYSKLSLDSRYDKNRKKQRDLQNLVDYREWIKNKNER